MADVKKDQERDELFRRIYKIATDLVHAGHVAEWDFKSYVLGTMFYRYISENFTAYINEGEHAAGNKDFDYRRSGVPQEIHFFIADFDDIRLMQSPLHLRCCRGVVRPKRLAQVGVKADELALRFGVCHRPLGRSSRGLIS